MVRLSEMASIQLLKIKLIDNFLESTKGMLSKNTFLIRGIKPSMRDSRIVVSL
jgi:hypothetical protein